MDSTMFYKPEVREKMLRRRNQLDQVSILQASQAAAAQVVTLKEFLNAEHIAFYMPITNELDPQPIMHAAEGLKKKLYLPAFAGSQPPETLIFFHYKMGDPLQQAHGFLQPELNPNPPPLDAKDLNLIFLPLVAFDSIGNRLGRGAGHYDRTLAFIKGHPLGKKTFLIGLGYEFQFVPEIKPDKWDVPMDMVVTEKNIYTRPDVKS